MKRVRRRGSAKRSKDGAGMSLFPFLAVLICTVGALIVLLVVIGRHARVQAAQMAKAQKTEVQKDLKQEREDVEWHIEELEKSLEATRKQLVDARLELGHLEDHSRQLRDQLEGLERAWRELEQAKPNPDQQETAERQLKDLSKRIADMKRRVDEARREAMTKQRSYAVVPYKGPHGTHRRPIYLECRADAIILQPEGIAFTPADFDGPLGPGNPLAAALRATREYLLNAGRFDPKKAGEPYPLLLVRPSGIHSYYAARAAMNSWESDFGYEMIDADWQLDFDAPDEELARVVRQEIEEARARQIRIARAAPRYYRHLVDSAASGGGGKPQYTVSSSTGEVVPYGNGLMEPSGPRDSGTTRRRPRWTPPSNRNRSSEGDGAGRGFGGGNGNGNGNDDGSGNGFGSGNRNRLGNGNGYGQDNDQESGNGYGGNGSGANGSGANEYGGNGYGTGNGNGQGSGLGDGSSSGTGATGPGSADGGTSPWGPNGLGHGSGIGNGQGPRGPGGAGSSSLNGSVDGTSGGATGGAQGGTSSNGTRNGFGGAADGTIDGPLLENPLRSGSGSGAGSGNGTSGTMNGGSSGSTGSTGASGTSGSASGGTVGGGSTGGASSGAVGLSMGGSSGGASCSTSGSSQVMSINMGSGGERSASMGPTEGSTANGHSDGIPYSYSQGATGGSSGGSGAQGSTGHATGQGSQRHLGEWYPSSTDRDAGRPGQGRPSRQKNRDEESLAKQRGKDWALPETSPRATPLTQPVRIECHADRLVLVPQRGLAGGRTISLGPNARDSVDELVSAIWNYTEGWGMAGRGMYWRPVLHVYVYPGAEERYHEMDSLLRDSGLSMERKK